MQEFFTEYGATLLWVLVTAGVIAVEGLTGDLVAIWFLPGSVTSLILSIFVDKLWIQLLVFAVLSAVALILTKVVFRKLFSRGKIYTSNSDALIGEHAVVEEEINNLRETGSVRIKGLTWSARAVSEEDIIPAGSVVTVCEISGVKLICRAETEK